MSDVTKIEWCDSTFNPWIGCTKISPACDHCYAEAQMDTRMGRVEWGAGKPRSRTSAAYWREPLRWNAQEFMQCLECGHRGPKASGTASACENCMHDAYPARRRVFCASLADVFDNEVPAEWLANLLSLISKTPNLDWLLLTKRIGNVRSRISAAGDAFLSKDDSGYAMAMAWWLHRPPTNVWIGATVVNQAEADRDIPKLLAVPAARRFLSIEPMLGPVYLYDWWLKAPTHCERCDSSGPGGGREFTTCPWGACPHDTGANRLDWVIAGGESGLHARPMHPDWVRSLRDQCAAAGVPFLFKQWGEWLPAGQTASTKLPTMTREEQVEQEMAGRFQFVRCPSNADIGTAVPVWRIGKHAAGRNLDGREHSEWPA